MSTGITSNKTEYQEDPVPLYHCIISIQVEVYTKVRNTMLTFLMSDRNLFGIHISFEDKETYTKEVLWVSRSCDHFLTNFICFVESTACLHWNLVQKGIYEVRDRMVSNFAFQGGSELFEPTCLKVMGGAGIGGLHNGGVVDFFPNS